MSMAPELRICGFCRSGATLEPIIVNDQPRWRVRCLACNSVSMHFDTQRLAAAEWNDHQQQRREPRHD
jgi:hypothetical protein